MFGTTQRPLVWQLRSFVFLFFSPWSWMDPNATFAVYLRPCWKITTQTFNLKAAGHHRGVKPAKFHMIGCTCGTARKWWRNWCHILPLSWQQGGFNWQWATKYINPPEIENACPHHSTHKFEGHQGHFVMYFMIHGSQVQCWTANQRCFFRHFVQSRCR